MPETRGRIFHELSVIGPPLNLKVVDIGPIGVVKR